MQDYRVEAGVSKDGSVTVKGLPFHAGDKVEVIIRGQASPRGNGLRYPLRGKAVGSSQMIIFDSPSGFGGCMERSG